MPKKSVLDGNFERKRRKQMQDLKVIYEDNHIIVVEKKPNVPSQADKTGDVDMLTIIKKYIKEKNDDRRNKNRKFSYNKS